MDDVTRRIQREIKLLREDGFTVQVDEANMMMIYIKFLGPAESLYEGGVWKLSADFSDDFPRKPPVVKFVNRIYHPNVTAAGESSGFVCLNLLDLDDGWKSDFVLSTILAGGLPILLREPNDEDYLNADAARLYSTNRDQFNDRVREHIAAYARDDQMAGF